MANLITSIRIVCSMALMCCAALFILPLTFSFIDLRYSAAVVCLVATFAAVQEGHFIRTKKTV